MLIDSQSFHLEISIDSNRDYINVRNNYCIKIKMIVPNQIWNCAIIINLLNQSSKINALEMDDNPQMNLTTTETETNYE